MDEKNEIDTEIDQNTLRDELAERRRALSEIRGTAYKIVAVVSAAGIVLFWLLLTECNLTISQTIALSIFVIAMTGFVYFFLNSLHKGFQKNRETMVKLETRLGLYNNKLLPMDYQCTKEKSTDFMHMTKWFILFVAVAILAVSWGQCIVSFCGICKEAVVQQKQSPRSSGFEISVKSKEAKFFSINIKYNDGGAE